MEDNNGPYPIVSWDPSVVEAMLWESCDDKITSEIESYPDTLMTDLEEIISKDLEVSVLFDYTIIFLSIMQLGLGCYRQGP